MTPKEAQRISAAPRFRAKEGARPGADSTPTGFRIWSRERLTSPTPSNFAAQRDSRRPRAPGPDDRRLSESSPCRLRPFPDGDAAHVRRLSSLFRHRRSVDRPALRGHPHRVRSNRCPFLSARIDAGADSACRGAAAAERRAGRAKAGASLCGPHLPDRGRPGRDSAGDAARLRGAGG